MERKQKKVISLELDTGAYQDFVDEALRLGTERISSYVCVANVHMCIEAYDDPEFARCVNGADLITPDGMPLAKAVRFLYGQQQDRVAGMDLLPSLLQEAEQRNLSVFFFGGQEETLDRTADYLKENYPKLQNVNYYSPPFRALSEEEEKEIVDRINQTAAQLVFVILGCPKQEKWMARQKGKIQACMLGIGGALPVLIGEQKRAPRWMQKASLEWLYRFAQEPKRLFKRYFYTNSKFLLLFAGAYLRKIFGRQK